METRQYSCTKCAGADYSAGEIRTTGSGISRFLNLQNQKFHFDFVLLDERDFDFVGRKVETGGNGR